MGSAYTTLAVHRTDVDMAPRSAGRTSNPNKPGYFNTGFEQTNDHHQYHEKELVKAVMSGDLLTYINLINFFPK